MQSRMRVERGKEKYIRERVRTNRVREADSEKAKRGVRKADAEKANRGVRRAKSRKAEGGVAKANSKRVDRRIGKRNHWNLRVHECSLKELLLAPIASRYKSPNQMIMSVL